MASNTAKFTGNFSSLGKTINFTVPLAGASAPIINETLAAAKVGTLTTRTGNTVGTLTMVTGHGFTTGCRIDLYWQLAGVWYCQRGILVGTVSTNSVPFTDGVGANLPGASTAITAMIPNQFPLAIVGNNLQALFAQAQPAGAVLSPVVTPTTVSFQSSVPVEIVALSMLNAPIAYGWMFNSSALPSVIDEGGANPLSGATVATVYLSHGYSGGSADLLVFPLSN